MLLLQQQGRELPGDGSGVDAAVMLQMRGLIISGEPYTERKSTFQVGDNFTSGWAANVAHSKLSRPVCIETAQLACVVRLLTQFDVAVSVRMLPTTCARYAF